MIDNNKNDPTMMWKTVKKVIREDKTGAKEINNVDFETLRNIEECNLADKFNLYYIQSIDDIINSIRKEFSKGLKTIYVIDNKEIIENFELIDIYKLERIVMGLPSKKGTDEGITSDLLKACFYIVFTCFLEEELLKVVNDSLSKGTCPEGWKTSTIIPIVKV